MIRITGFAAILGGIAVLVGKYTEFLKEYPLIPVGAGIAILAGFLDKKKKG